MGCRLREGRVALRLMGQASAQRSPAVAIVICWGATN